MMVTEESKRNSLKLSSKNMAEGVGFEPTVRLPVRLISSQVPSTTQPPFQPKIGQLISHV